MKICIVFPGIGYHVDKPLLYYSKKMAASYGYEIKEIKYINQYEDIMHNIENRLKAIEDMYNQVLEQVKNINWKEYESILFISKSIGTTISCKLNKELNLNAYSILYTPIVQTFDYVNSNCVVFHGTNDPWMDSELCIKKLNDLNLNYHIVEDTNHSLETKDILLNINNLQKVMYITNQYLMEIQK